MTWVKICGLTSRRDVLNAVASGADAIGFNTIPSSVRHIDAGRIRALARQVDIETYLLTVDLGPEAVLDLVEHTGVTGIQPYGAHAVDVIRAALDSGLRALHPIPMSRFRSPVPAATPLLDSGHNRLGGTGETFDWESIPAGIGDYVLAGGLGVDNIAGAVRALRPWGVDAASRLEAGPGVKDPVKVAAFIERAKSA